MLIKCVNTPPVFIPTLARMYVELQVHRGCSRSETSLSFWPGKVFEPLNVNALYKCYSVECSSSNCGLQSAQFLIWWKKGQAAQCIDPDQRVGYESVTMETTHSQ